MVNLGNMEKDLGNVAQARHWYQQAIGTGHPEMAHQAQQEMRALDQHEDECLRAEHLGRYGYLVNANPDWMNRDEEHSETSGADVTDHASEQDDSDDLT
jgi:hypothetical protein